MNPTNDDEDRHSSSDDEQSDEDYNPLKEKATELSEEESDDAISDGEEASSAPTKRCNQKTVQKTKRSLLNKAGRGGVAGEDIKTSDINSESESPSKCINDSKEDDKERADALWADFLGGTDDAYKKPVSKVTASTERKSTKGEQSPAKNKALEITEKKQLVTETVEYAGEKIDIVKEVPIATTSTRSGHRIEIPSSTRKRSFGGGGSGGGGGLSSVLGQIGKKNKIGTLEKTKLDWNTFKRSEGIDEQLQTHNKGKDGYLERQDFLQRTDVRQFHLEKNLRQTKRTNR